jgi:predicted metal-dependent enzyme (double-stranded beta helix superfamily)
VTTSTSERIQLKPPLTSGMVGHHDLLAVAEELANTARRRAGMKRPRRRSWDLLAASDQFEAWVIAWPPGGTIELHDHGGSAGAVVVVTGELTETTLSEPTPRRIELVTTQLDAGGAVSFGPRCIHDMANVSAALTISVHVYAPRLTAMTYYRVAGDRLEVNRTVRYRLGKSYSGGDPIG